MKKSLKLLFFSVICSFSIISCQYIVLVKEALGLAKDVVSLIELGNEIIGLMNEFTTHSNELSINVNAMQKAVVDGFEKGETTSNIAIFWEGEWGVIHSQFDDLKSSIARIDDRTNVYFGELMKNNLSISDSTLKQMDTQQNIELRKRYDIEREKAETAILTAEAMLKKGDDFQYVLRNQVLRSSIEQNIIAVKDISLQAQSLTGSIETFTTNCKPLFQSNL